MAGTLRGVSDPFITAAQLEGVPSAYAATRDGIDSLLRDRGLRRSTPDDTARSLLLDIAACPQCRQQPMRRRFGQPQSGDDLRERLRFVLSL